MSDKVFVDTNILVYAHDSSNKYKHAQAAAIINQLWDEKTGSLSTQVLQEFYITVTRKISVPIDHLLARTLISRYQHWDVNGNDIESSLDTIDIQIESQVSFWDALIIQAANRAGAQTLLSEDLNDQQLYREIRVINPFRYPNILEIIMGTSD